MVPFPGVWFAPGCRKGSGGEGAREDAACRQEGTCSEGCPNAELQSGTQQLHVLIAGRAVPANGAL